MSYLLLMQCYLCCLPFAMQPPLGEDKNPYGKQLHEKLTVEWGKPAKGKPRVGHARLVVPFTVYVTMPDSKKQAVDWQLPVVVVVNRLPGKRLDLTKAFKEEEVVYSNVVVVKSSGKAEARIDLSVVHTIIGKVEYFECFVHLPTRSWDRVMWSAKDQIVSNSVVMLPIPGPPEMDEIQIAINHCPTLNQKQFNPINVLKAVNPLVRLGKDKAIQELQRYHDLAGCELERNVVRVESSDAATRFCIRVITDTIFETPQATGIRSKDRRDIVMSDGIPFSTGPFAFFGFTPIDLTKYLAQLKKDGKMLSNELVPSSNPLRAADSAYAILKANDPKSKWADNRYRWRLREQALLMIQPLYPVATNHSISEEEWKEHIQKVDALGLKWNREKCEYEVSKK